MKTTGRLPDFIVIGAPKAGTTSLHFYLGLHPQIHMCKPKEPRFFVKAPPPAGHWELGLDWYRSLFRTEKAVCGEASPYYSGAPTIGGVPERMHSVIPGSRFIYLLRQPYERLCSHYLMDFRKGIFPCTFQDYVEQRTKALDLSCYGTQLAEYRRYFPPERILIVETTDLERHRISTLQGIFRFLGVGDDFTTPLFFHRRNIGAAEKFPSPLGRRILASRPMRVAERTLHVGVYYHLKNLVMKPFGQPAPSMVLPDDLQRSLKARLRDEVARLRELSGLALPSLDVP